jgi:hypothetical protein
MTRVHSLAIVALLPLAGTVPRPEPARGLMDFLDRVAEYVEIRREVTAGIDGPALCSDLEELSRQAHQRAAAIRDARPLAREGTVFTPRAAELFRARLLRAAQNAATDITPWVNGGDDVVLEVHTVLPWGIGTPASAGLVGLLPTLPEELEYRFVGRHLVLLDVELNLVVDVLREAAPARIETPANRSLGTCDVHPKLRECWM